MSLNYALKSIKWHVLCYKYFTTIKNSKQNKERAPKAGAWTQGLEVEGLEVEICELLPRRGTVGKT